SMAEWGLEPRLSESQSHAGTGTQPVHHVVDSTILECLFVLETSFYFLNIFSHGVLPPHCNQRFLPCEIGCIKYSLKDGIIADFHHFIDPGEVPRGFRFHCQAAGDITHKIPISGFELATANHSVVLRELYTFIQPHWGTWPPVYCKSDDHFRVNWCLNHMAREAVNHLVLLSAEDLVVDLYYQKLQKEPSKTWVCNTLDASMWDYSVNTRCRWHEENDVLFCALATCKKIAYCISNSLANMYEIQLTSSHLPLREKDSQSTINPKMIVLDAGQPVSVNVLNWHIGKCPLITKYFLLLGSLSNLVIELLNELTNLFKACMCLVLNYRS
uniref:Maelstrom spermatogenic transposon silencer n=1 Tax=Varanus komodoensis TaxID=61221 RepID=A0A8D2L774_VARKO